MIDKDYYQILHVNEDATLEEIRQARNLLLQQFHPDKISRDLKEKGSEYFTVIAQEINEAFKVLSNPVKRAEYDFQRKNGKIPPPSAAPNPVVSPLTLNFGKVTRGSISKLIFKFENTGGAIQEINFSYSEDGGWFKIANTESPDFPRLVEVTSDTHSLTKGENYNGWIDINCDGIVVRVNLEVQIDDTPETNESYKPSITVLKQTPMWGHYQYCSYWSHIFRLDGLSILRLAAWQSNCSFTSNPPIA